MLLLIISLAFGLVATDTPAGEERVAHVAEVSENSWHENAWYLYYRALWEAEKENRGLFEPNESIDYQDIVDRQLSEPVNELDSPLAH